MSSFSDLMSSAIAMMMSAAFVHFGVTGGSAPHKDTTPPPAHASASVSASSVSDAPPVPGDDDRFENSASAPATTHVAKARHSLQ